MIYLFKKYLCVYMTVYFSNISLFSFRTTWTRKCKHTSTFRRNLQCWKVLRLPCGASRTPALPLKRVTFPPDALPLIDFYSFNLCVPNLIATHQHRALHRLSTSEPLQLFQVTLQQSGWQVSLTSRLGKPPPPTAPPARTRRPKRHREHSPGLRNSMSERSFLNTRNHKLIGPSHSRPKSLNDVTAQDHTITVLQRSLQASNVRNCTAPIRGPAAGSPSNFVPGTL